LDLEAHDSSCLTLLTVARHSRFGHGEGAEKAAVLVLLDPSTLGPETAMEKIYSTIFLILHPSIPTPELSTGL
jgi:hypothetical protein